MNGLSVTVGQHQSSLIRVPNAFSNMSIILVFCVAFATIYFLMHWYKVFLCGIRLPGPWSFPLLGNVQFIENLKPESELQQMKIAKKKN